MPWTFREVCGEQELEAVFRLRYRAFCRSDRSPDVAASDSGGIDISTFDGSARHYAVFDIDDRPIATVRAVGRDADGTESPVARIRQRHARDPHAGRSVGFPLLDSIGWFALRPDIREHLGGPRPVVEIGRMCRDPDVGNCGPRAFRTLAEGTLAAEFFVRDTTYAIGIAIHGLEPVYVDLGFRVVHDFLIPIRNTSLSGSLMGADRRAIHGHPLAGRWADLADELERDGRLSRPAMRLAS